MEKMEAGLRGLCIQEIDVKSQILVTKYYSKLQFHAAKFTAIAGVHLILLINIEQHQVATESQTKGTNLGNKFTSMLLTSTTTINQWVINYLFQKLTFSLSCSY